MCDAGRWLVLSSPATESLAVLLRGRADAITDPSYTRGAIDRKTGDAGQPDVYRVLLCRPLGGQ